ncbi:MAG TPA: tRNA (cytidine(34)-2'-O)-methyltransferase [Steroidobacteraceae bacterium]|jgi:tRNA (cytidine/uridine-2'-O-)-methyltransferase
MFHILLHEPQIPPNTGNIIRLCANTGCLLHLIGPLGFDLDRRSVRRAGLDYALLAQVRTHATLDDCLSALAPATPDTAPGRLWAIETGAARHYSEARFEPGDLLLFGAETRGLPAELLAGLPPERRLSIPMRHGNRSLNLANAVAVVAYEAWRQQGFR